jgi:16S rRNA processing protein RimM
METGAHDVLRIRPPAMTSEASAVTPAKGARKNADPDERLIPFVAAYVDGVDIASRRITVDWGLDY